MTEIVIEWKHEHVNNLCASAHIAVIRHAVWKNSKVIRFAVLKFRKRSLSIDGAEMGKEG